MIKKKNLIFLGPPGAGKGTLSEELLRQVKLAHISTGDLLRAEIKNGTELGKKAKECVDNGKLVPDQVVTDMVAERLKNSDCNAGFILDGFPRTVPQAELLKAELSRIGKKIDCVVYFAASEELLLERLTSRITCRKCAKNYNKTFMPPKQEGLCDSCGGELYQRPDDSLETAKKRLEVYNTQTAPLIEFYKKEGLLMEIDSALPKPEAAKNLLATLN